MRRGLPVLTACTCAFVVPGCAPPARFTFVEGRSWADGGGGESEAEGESEGDGDPGNGIDPEWPPDEPLPAAFDLPPYLTLLDATTVVVSWRSARAAAGTVRWGEGPDLPASVLSPAGTDHHIALSGLRPASGYTYQVAIDGTDAVRHGVFVTPGRSEWRFLHLAEFHAPSHADQVAAFAPVVRDFRPHLLVESGDMVDDGTDADDWRAYLRTSAPWISNAPILPCHSNHANGVGGNPNLLDLFVLPGNERWYATRWGRVQILTIDSTWTVNQQEVAEDQIPWVRERAAEAHDGAGDPDFLIAAWHYPACSSSFASRESTREWVMDNLVSALVEGGGVDLILVGHDRYFERSTIEGGIVHVMTNIGKLAPGAAGDNHPACTAEVTHTDVRSTLLVEVSDAALSARAVESDGTVLDEFTIER